MPSRLRNRKPTTVDTNPNPIANYESGLLKFRRDGGFCHLPLLTCRTISIISTIIFAIAAAAILYKDYKTFRKFNFDPGSLHLGEKGAQSVSSDTKEDEIGLSSTRIAESTIERNFEELGGRAKHAFERAKTRQCKEAIYDIDKRQKSGRLYYTNLPTGSCPSSNISKAHFVACFLENVNRTNGFFVNKRFKVDNKPDKCIEHCFMLGLPYAGLHRGSQCQCAFRISDLSALPPSRCKCRCPGNSSQICGGWKAISVYATAVGTLNYEVKSSNISEQARSPARIAFVLILNGRALRQVGRLLRLIYRPEHFYFFHVDKRLNYLHAEITKMTRGIPNIYIADGDLRISPIWGGSSLLTLLLSACEYLIDRSDWNWDFVMNLSETDFPLRPVDELAMYLGAHKGVNFLGINEHQPHEFVKKHGFRFTFVECESRMWQLNERTLPRGIRFLGGSDWVTLSREFVTYLVEGQRNSDPFLTGLRILFNYTLMAPESYFHTVVMNSEFCGKVSAFHMRHINWQRERGGCNCNRKFADWCGCSPLAFQEKDYWELEQRTPNLAFPFMGRKFEETICQKAVNLVEFRVLHSLRENTPAFDHYWYCEFSLASDGLNYEPFRQRHTFYRTLLHMAANSLLLPYEPRRDDCQRFLSAARILSVHSLFVQDMYQGILVEFDMGGSVFESFFARSEENRNSEERAMRALECNCPMQNLFSSWGYQLASFSVGSGSDFDEKERIFRNVGSIFTFNQTVCLRVAWKKFREFPMAGPNSAGNSTNNPIITLNVIISEPDGFEGTWVVHLNPTRETIECTCQGCFRLTKPGFWRVRMHHSGIAIGDPFTFAVLSEEFSPSLARLVSPTFFTLLDICQVSPPPMTIFGYFQNDCFTKSEADDFFRPCKSKPWSSHYFDFKSTPNFVR